MNTAANPAIARDAAIADINTRIAPLGLHAGLTIGSIARIKGSSSYDELVAITGNTFPVKDALKAAGAKWSGYLKAWCLTLEQAQTAAAAL